MYGLVCQWYSKAHRRTLNARKHIQSWAVFSTLNAKYTSRSHNTWESDDKFCNSLDEIMAMLAKLVMYSTSLNFSDENKNEVRKFPRPQISRSVRTFLV